MADFANRRIEDLNNMSWKFEKTSDEEFGPEQICTLNAEQNGIHVGFEATNSEDFSGYIEGFFKSDGRTEWVVDDHQPNSIDLKFNAYSERYVSEKLPASLRDRILSGNTLEMIGGKGNRLTVSLRGMREAALKFEACLWEEYAKSDPPKTAPSSFENSVLDRQQSTDMLYGGLTIRLPEFIVNAATSALVRNGKDIGSAFEFGKGAMRRFQPGSSTRPIYALVEMQSLRRVTYRVDEPGWAVLSGFLDASETVVYYGVCRKAKGNLVCIDFVYNKHYRNVMDDIVKAASLSLKR
ncbi:MAG: hypothetical protein EOP06_19285 [Proteobacteria bacterium]|nr:MAG: hypothetical protein EOP06_19285 [Pseudomonadota bacterium]